MDPGLTPEFAHFTKKHSPPRAEIPIHDKSESSTIPIHSGRHIPITHWHSDGGNLQVGRHDGQQGFYSALKSTRNEGLGTGSFMNSPRA